MKLGILGAESLGGRGLCCRVQVGERVIVIDPGVALGEDRFDLPPHPVQVCGPVSCAQGRRIDAVASRQLSVRTSPACRGCYGSPAAIVDRVGRSMSVAQAKAMSVSCDKDDGSRFTREE